jgi:hypothetical protein
MAEMMWRLKQEAKSLPSAALPPHLFNTWRYFDGAMFGISSKSIDVHDRLFMAGEGQCMVCKQSRREPRLDEVPVGTPADTHPGWTERIPEWTQSAAEMSWIDFD